MKFIGMSKVALQNKITVIEPIAKLLMIQPGDEIAFLRSASGDIVIKKLSDVEIKEVE